LDEAFGALRFRGSVHARTLIDEAMLDLDNRDLDGPDGAEAMEAIRATIDPVEPQQRADCPGLDPVLHGDLALNLAAWFGEGWAGNAKLPGALGRPGSFVWFGCGDRI
jgi:hypothetical protein